jgi:hypothetical protein
VREVKAEHVGEIFSHRLELGRFSHVCSGDGALERVLCVAGEMSVSHMMNGVSVARLATTIIFVRCFGLNFTVARNEIYVNDVFQFVA